MDSTASHACTAHCHRDCLRSKVSEHPGKVLITAFRRLADIAGHINGIVHERIRTSSPAFFNWPANRNPFQVTAVLSYGCRLKTMRILVRRSSFDG